MIFEHEKLEYDEIELNILGILKECKKRIKWIVLMAVIVALSLPTVIYIDDIKGKNTVGEIVYSQEDQLIADEYFVYKNIRNDLDAYMDKSPIMSIDYYNTYQGELQFIINAEENVREVIVEYLYNYMMGLEAADELCKALDIEQMSYVKEIFDISQSGKSERILYINVIASNEDECKKYINAINDIIAKESTELQDEIGQHSIELIQENIVVGYSEKVYTLQQGCYDYYKTVNKTLVDYESVLSTTQKMLIMEMADDIEFVIEKDTPTFDIKYAVIGFILGGIVAIFIIIVRLVLIGVIQSTDEVHKRLNIIKAGVISRDKSNWDSIAHNILFLLGEKKQYIVGFISSMPKESINSEIRTLYEILEKNNIQIVQIDNIVEHNAFSDLSDVSSVFLIEKVGESKVKKIYQEASMCETMGIELLGYICIEE